jgi:hypothetical protein
VVEAPDLEAMVAEWAERLAERRASCLVAEHCWDPVSRAIIMYGHQFERLRSGDLGGREPCSKSIRMPAPHLLPARK